MQREDISYIFLAQWCEFPSKKTTVAARFSAKQESFVLIAIWGIGGTLPSFDNNKKNRLTATLHLTFSDSSGNTFFYSHTRSKIPPRGPVRILRATPGQTTTTFIWEREGIYFLPGSLKEGGEGKTYL